MVDGAEVVGRQVSAAGAQLEVPTAMVIVDADALVCEEPAYLIVVGLESGRANLDNHVATAARLAQVLAGAALLAISVGFSHALIPTVRQVGSP